jgi:hypothetical protein
MNILVLGDSHTKVFKYYNNIKPDNKLFKFNVTNVGGDTAYGMINKKSITNALNVFSNKLSEIENTKKYNITKEEYLLRIIL